MATKAGAPRVASLRRVKSDVVVGLPDDGAAADRLDVEEPGWDTTAKYVSLTCCISDRV